VNATLTSPITVTGIDAVYYLAKDFNRGVAFYRDVLGLAVAREGDNYVEFDLGDGNTFGVSHMPHAWYPCGGTIFTVTDIDAAAARLHEAGVKFFTEGIIDSPVCRMAWCEDSEGNNFAIHKLK
jgi:predicted enzyme related to lactoylglutathione lyase